jgi:hypothetical protein
VNASLLLHTLLRIPFLRFQIALGRYWVSAEQACDCSAEAQGFQDRVHLVSNTKMAGINQIAVGKLATSNTRGTSEFVLLGNAERLFYRPEGR